MATVMNRQNGKQSDGFARHHRRKQLIEATIKSIAEHGLSRVTLAKVASTAQLSPGIVNFYFNSKEQLLLETLKDMEQEFDAHLKATIGAGTDPADTLVRLIDAFFDPKVFNIEKATVWSAFWGESQARRDYLTICGEKDAELYNVIHDAFVRLRDAEARTEFDTHAAARGFEGLLDCFWQDLVCSPEDFDRDAVSSTCIGYLRNLFPDRFQKPTSNQPRIETEIRTLMAPWTYFNKEFFDLEIDQIFKRNWLVAGHVSELQNAGDFITFDALGERAIIVRGTDQKLRAFHNVCRHRGGRIVRGQQGNCKKAFVCPFHGWTYNLDGSLKNVPAAKTFKNLDKNSHGLVALDVEVWHGFVFIRFGGDAKSVAQQFSAIEEKVAPYRLEKMLPMGPSYVDTRPVNWKVFHDIDNEGYHVPIGHPGLHALFGKQYQDVSVEDVPCSYGRIQDEPARQWSVAKYQKLLPHYDHLPEDSQRLWFYFGLFPNAVFELHPECASYYMTIPDSPGKVTLISRYFALPDERREARAARYLCLRINEQVGYEDESFVDWVQEGLQSSVYPEATLSTIESGVSGFHQDIQSVLPVGRLAREPAAGTVGQINAAMQSGA